MFEKLVALIPQIICKMRSKCLNEDESLEKCEVAES